ncbi:uncharacterized protein LOC143197007 [Rhynchophorus ferrugineus]|uniref:PDZ domain-containing protein n=1 Tax=Rhynchophorus ferrugineus TaxID=354439 RepID=A0A834J3B6_RHYFE|nr:hypothetical protein GWI33_001387 [Rhynchophorus ferrugineus]
MSAKTIASDATDIDLNSNLSKKWKKLCQRCSSLRSYASLDTSKYAFTTSSLRFPNSTKKVQDALKLKFNQINIGFRKRKTLSVQELFRQQPEYGSSGSSTELPGFHQVSHQSNYKGKPGSSFNLSVDNVDRVHYYEPPPDYDVDLTLPQSKRWSVAVNDVCHREIHTYRKQETLSYNGNYTMRIPKSRSLTNYDIDHIRSQFRDRMTVSYATIDNNNYRPLNKIQSSRKSYAGIDSIQENIFEELPDVRNRNKYHSVRKNHFTIKKVCFQKGPQYKPLGFSIVGGRDSPKGNIGIYVKTIFVNGQAAEAGNLREGDEILAVNNVPLHGVAHKEAVTIFKNIRTGTILLHIGRRV